MKLNKILRKSFVVVNKYSLPFKAILFENLTKNTYNSIFLNNPDRFGLKHSALLDRMVNKLDDNATVLDLGCGNGKDAFWLAKQGMFVDAVDLADESIKIISNRIDEEIKNNIILHQSSIKEYLNKNTKQYNLISCQNALQFDSDWYSRIKEMQDYTLAGGYNTLSGPLGMLDGYRYGNPLDKQKIVDLYQDRELVFLEEFNDKQGDNDRPRLSFIAQKK